MIEQHDILEVKQECEGGGGYLAAVAGERIEVLHFQEDLELEECGGGWVYARHTKDQGLHGWMARSSLDVPQKSLPPAFGRLQKGMVVSTVLPLKPQPDTGYLVAAVGTVLEVVHVAVDEDDGWIYAQRRQMDDGMEPWHMAGWLEAGAVRSQQVFPQLGQPPPPSQPPPLEVVAEVPEEHEHVQLGEDALHANIAEDALHANIAVAEALRKRNFRSDEHLTSLQDSSSWAKNGGLRDMNLMEAPRPSRPCPSPLQQSPVQRAPPLSPSRQAHLQRVPPPPLQPTCVQRAPLENTGGTLKVVTFGLENTDGELVNRCKDASGPNGGGGAFVEIEETELRMALRRKSYPDIDLVLDARCFPDPHAQHVTRHIGVHPEIVKRIVHHAHFRRYLGCVKDLWKKRLQWKDSHGGRPDWVLAVYCKSGKHRSVAVGECLRYIGEHAEGLRVLDTTHLSQPRWGKNVCKGCCDECTAYSEEKEQALKLAAQIWRES